MRVIHRAITLITAAGCLIATSVATTAVAAQAQTTVGWPQFQGNAAHTGDEPGENSVTRANVGQLSVAWTADLPSTSFNSEVVVTGGLAYVGSGQFVTAFNATSGAQVWQASLPGPLLGTPSVQGGLVLVAFSETTGPRQHHKGFVAALDSATGASIWTRQVGDLGIPSLGSNTTVTTTAQRAYVTLGGGEVVALGLSHGYKIWQSSVLPGCGWSQPSVAGDLVVVGGGGGFVSALNASNGTQAWTDTLGGSCGFSSENWLPAISQGVVYAGLLDGVAALSLASGTVLWENQSVSSVDFPLSLTGKAVIAGPNSDKMAAFSRSDGSVLWRRSLSGQVAGTATFGGLSWGLLQNDGEHVEAVAFGGATGHRDFASAPLSYTDTQGMPPVVSAGRVYVNLGGELLCLALPTAG